MAENLYGPEAGHDKKAFVEGVLSDVTHVLSQRFHAGEELHPDVKLWRPELVDAAVAIANWRGLFPATTGQRLNAGLALGYVQLPIADLYAKIQRGETLNENEHKQWEAFAASLPEPVVDQQKAVSTAGTSSEVPKKRKSRKQKEVSR